MRGRFDEAGEEAGPTSNQDRVASHSGGRPDDRRDEGGAVEPSTAPRPRLVRLPVGRRVVRPVAPASERPAVSFAARVEEERQRWP